MTATNGSFRVSERIKRTRIARDFRSNSRRRFRCILYVFIGRDNAEFGRKDKQDGTFYSFRDPYLIKRLYRMGYGKQDVILLFEFIDWVMSLPKDLEKNFWVEIREMEEEAKMEYISSVQRIGREEGRQEGRQEGTSNVLGRMISKRFRVERESVFPIFSGLSAAQIEELADFFMETDNLDEIRKKADEMRKSRASDV